MGGSPPTRWQSRVFPARLRLSSCIGERGAMSGTRETILGWIEQDREKLVGFLSEFVRVPSPNPPGDTRAAAAFLHEQLRTHGVPVEYRTAKPEWPNVVGTFAGHGAGPHLVLNGHIDVFPAG